MHILILGGTVFVGRALVDEALARGHTVTIFNRGTRTAPEGVAVVTGDRLAPDGYSGLDSMSFDAVIDTWSWSAEAVTTAVEALQGRTRHYTYVSTVAVYEPEKLDVSQQYTEDAPLYRVDIDRPDRWSYAHNKRCGEIAAEKAEVPVFLVRPGVILGPHEHVLGSGGRLVWWLSRFHGGGRMVAPGPKELRTTFLDVRDLATFIITGAEKGLAGAYSVLGGPILPTMGQLLDTMNDVTGGHAQLVWKTPEEILAIGVDPIYDLPLWYPPGSEKHILLNNWDTTKARRDGLVTRPIRDTLKDTWDWIQSGQDVPPMPPGRRTYGLAPEQEAAILN
ncbi:putative NAD-dependent epimerase/dehydratase [Thozetella sp. PMI_491]|nr:putative NAD-dependent epimerase/dehydratase [Thozetella sp. PMI_491]